MMMSGEQKNGIKLAEELQITESSLGYPIFTVVEEREKPPENLESQEQKRVKIIRACKNCETSYTTRLERKLSHKTIFVRPTWAPFA